MSDIEEPAREALPYEAEAMALVAYACVDSDDDRQEPWRKIVDFASRVAREAREAALKKAAEKAYALLKEKEMPAHGLRTYEAILALLENPQ